MSHQIICMQAGFSAVQVVFLLIFNPLYGANLTSKTIVVSGCEKNPFAVILCTTGFLWNYKCACTQQGKCITVPIWLQYYFIMQVEIILFIVEGLQHKSEEIYWYIHVAYACGSYNEKPYSETIVLFLLYRSNASLHSTLDVLVSTWVSDGGRQLQTQASKQTNKQKDRVTETLTTNQSTSQPDRQTDRQADRQACMQRGRQIDKLNYGILPKWLFKTFKGSDFQSHIFRNILGKILPDCSPV